MGSLWKFDDHVIVIDGKLIICDECPCDKSVEYVECAKCPTDCSALPAYTATISGWTGGCVDCDSEYDGAFALTRTGCTWNHYTGGPAELILDIECVEIGGVDVWQMSIAVNCYGSGSCWYDGTLTGTIPAKATPTGAYNISGTLSGSGTYNVTATVVVS